MGMRNHSADGPEAWASTAEEVPGPQARLPELPFGLEVTFRRMNKGVWVFPPPCTLMLPAPCGWWINAGKLDQRQFTLRLSATSCSALTGAMGLRSSPNKTQKIRGSRPCGKTLLTRVDTLPGQHHTAVFNGWKQPELRVTMPRVTPLALYSICILFGAREHPLLLSHIR